MAKTGGRVPYVDFRIQRSEKRHRERELEETNPPQAPQPPKQQFGGVGIEAIRQLRDKRRLKNKKNKNGHFQDHQILRKDTTITNERRNTISLFYKRKKITLNKKGGGISSPQVFCISIYIMLVT